MLFYTRKELHIFTAIPL